MKGIEAKEEFENQVELNLVAADLGVIAKLLRDASTESLFKASMLLRNVWVILKDKNIQDENQEKWKEPMRMFAKLTVDYRKMAEGMKICADLEAVFK